MNFAQIANQLNKKYGEDGWSYDRSSHAAEESAVYYFYVGKKSVGNDDHDERLIGTLSRARWSARKMEVA